MDAPPAAVEAVDVEEEEDVEVAAAAEDAAAVVDVEQILRVFFFTLVIS